MCDDEGPTPIVLHCGSSMCRAGFASEENPRWFTKQFSYSWNDWTQNIFSLLERLKLSLKVSFPLSCGPTPGRTWHRGKLSERHVRGRWGEDGEERCLWHLESSTSGERACQGLGRDGEDLAPHLLQRASRWSKRPALANLWAPAEHKGKQGENSWGRI